MTRPPFKPDDAPTLDPYEPTRQQLFATLPRELRDRFLAAYDEGLNELARHDVSEIRSLSADQEFMETARSELAAVRDLEDAEGTVDALLDTDGDGERDEWIQPGDAQEPDGA